MRGYGPFSDLTETSRKTLIRISRGDRYYNESGRPPSAACHVLITGMPDYSALYTDLVTGRINPAELTDSRFGYVLYELCALAREVTKGE
jgi:hypothetical protein